MDYTFTDNAGPKYKKKEDRWGADGAVGDPSCDRVDCREWATNNIDGLWVCYKHRYDHFPPMRQAPKVPPLSK